MYQNHNPVFPLVPADKLRKPRESRLKKQEAAWKMPRCGAVGGPWWTWWSPAARAICQELDQNLLFLA